MDGRRRRAEGCAAAVKEAAVFAFRSGSGEERKDCSEEWGRKDERPIPRMDPEGTTASSETPTREAPDSRSAGPEGAEERPSPVEDGERGLRPPEGWKWTLNSGKARDWTPRDTEPQPQKPDTPESVEKHVGPLGAEAEKEEAGAQSRPLGALQDRCSTPSPLSPEDAGTGASRRQEEEAGQLRPPAAAPLSPPPPAPGERFLLPI